MVYQTSFPVRLSVFCPIIGESEWVSERITALPGPSGRKYPAPSISHSCPDKDLRYHSPSKGHVVVKVKYVCNSHARVYLCEGGQWRRKCVRNGNLLISLRYVYMLTEAFKEKYPSSSLPRHLVGCTRLTKLLCKMTYKADRFQTHANSTWHACVIAQPNVSENIRGFHEVSSASLEKHSKTPALFKLSQ